MDLSIQFTETVKYTHAHPLLFPNEVRHSYTFFQRSGSHLSWLFQSPGEETPHPADRWTSCEPNTTYNSLDEIPSQVTCVLCSPEPNTSQHHYPADTRSACFKIWSPNLPGLARPLPRPHHSYITLASARISRPALHGQGTHTPVLHTKWCMYHSRGWENWHRKAQYATPNCIWIYK